MRLALNARHKRHVYIVSLTENAIRYVYFKLCSFDFLRKILLMSERLEHHDTQTDLNQKVSIAS